MTTELDDLRRAVRDAVGSLGGTAVCRGLDPAGPGWDRRSWSVLAEQIGVGALGVSADHGGLGGLAEMTVVAEECGAVVLPVPYLSTVLAAQILSRTHGADDVLGEIAEGAPAAFLGLDRRGWWSPGGIGVTLGPGDADGALSGQVDSVLGAAGAHWFVVGARTTDGVELFVCDARHSGVHATPFRTLDLSRAHASVSLSEVPARRLASPDSVDAAVLHALDVAIVVLAAEQLGGAQASLDNTVAYVKERRQFGRAVGGFQAVKHSLADQLVLVESARSSVSRATEAAVLDEAAPLARSWCSDAYRTVSAEALQLHGGIGFTWEHDCHLYYRRARADAQLFGGSAFHRERLATALGW
ncbi:alkylation response protein AidB-like acyl-CoA dehydrogenase [Dietzia sp. 2505]|uniref:acyl-CoA dehydrogenase family protein n=1 Tax=Dietzia sp. 2505 TaxID=3156457 RepID=UPI003393B8A8